MAKGSGTCTTKIVGYLSKKIADKYNLHEYEGKEIVQSTRLDIHTNKHANDFITIDSYHNTLIEIDEIIKNPYFVEFDKKKKSLKYYGKVSQYVCIIVKIQDKKDLYVSTFYPQSKVKIDKIIHKKKKN